MQHLADLLAPLALPAVDGPLPPLTSEAALVHDLAAGLPAGHLHVWGGPSGAGKTAFLLSLLHGAALEGRRVVYATYDLPPETLALRLLAMAAEVDAAQLGAGTLEPEAAVRAARVRAALLGAPFQLLAARGLGVASLEDRLVRMPFRAEVLAVDYLQAVVREPTADAGRTLRDLSALATRLHVAVICALRPDERALLRVTERATERTAERLAGVGAERVEGLALDPVEATASVRVGVAVEAADRVGWIAPAGGSGARRAELLQNRYGPRTALPFTVDPHSGALHPA